MHTATKLHRGSSGLLPIASSLIVLAVFSTVGGIEKRYFCLVIPYVFFLAILKYRAAHHRKVRKRSRFYDDFETDSGLWASLKEILLFEAKVYPVDEPPLSDFWILFCYIVVAILFLQWIAMVYVMNLLMCFGIYETVVWFSGIRSSKMDNMVYNGRRYKCVHRDYFYAKIQDEEQNILYMPIMDLNGLIPLDNIP
jgi:hypothetical protein